ncbi:MAG: hypothetical protein ABW054_09930 [Casimicrobiaceae bacterium]
MATTAVPLNLPGSIRPPRARRGRGTSLPVVFIAPAIVAVFLISIYPIFDAAVLSLFQTRYAEKDKFIGAANYVALCNDASIWASAGKSLVYTGFSLLLVNPLSLGLAMLLNSRIPLRSTARTSPRSKRRSRATSMSARCRSSKSSAIPVGSGFSRPRLNAIHSLTCQ